MTKGTHTSKLPLEINQLINHESLANGGSGHRQEVLVVVLGEQL